MQSASQSSTAKTTPAGITRAVDHRLVAPNCPRYSLGEPVVCCRHRAGMGEPMSVRSYDWIAHHAQVRPDKVAMIDLRTDRRITYVEMHCRVDRLCAVLHRELGVVAGDRVA